ncbi:MAG: spore maturation protein [Oscillospiraceae bacterium]|jgi:spore maturation protein B|nr:spore maturation protein [Oscillospiraceae bacterium]
MEKLGSFILPGMIFVVVIFGFSKKVKIFDTFMKGAKEGLISTISIIPAIIGLIVSISMVKASGALDIFTSFVSPVFAFFGIPAKTVPLILLRPISGSGALAFVSSIFDSCGPDSLIGKVVSVMMGSTETTFYTIAVYCGSVGIKNIRHTVPAALSADFTGFIVSVLAVKLLLS